MPASLDVADLAQRTLDTLRDSLEEDWDALDDATKQLAKDAVQDVARLTVQEVRGEDVEAEMRMAKATLGNLQAAATIRIQSAVLDALQTALTVGVRALREAL